MKKYIFYIFLLFSFGYMTGCVQSTQHTDPFYNNVNDDFHMTHIPLVKPIYANLVTSSSSWEIKLYNIIWVDSPPENQGDNYSYVYIDYVEKFAVKNGVIMAYSSYVDKQADAYIQDNYYHWFVIVPEKEITKGFHTESEFSKYIQSLSVGDPDWQIPDDVIKQFRETNCLEWIPDCNQK